MNKLAILLLCIVLLTACSQSVKDGDSIKVWYSGRLENGEIFDTNIVDVAKSENIFNENRKYEPLEFVVGKGQVISGFEDGVIGMKIGEKNKITISPEKGYGEYDKKRIVELDRNQYLNRTAKISKKVTLSPAQFESYFKEKPELNKIYNPEKIPWKYKVLSIDEEMVISEAQIKVGEKYNLPGTEWNSEVISISKEEVVFRQDPKSGQKIMTGAGEAVVSVDKEYIIVSAKPEINQQIMSSYGEGIVKELNEEKIIVDVNHRLAGKTLIFYLELVEIEKNE